MIILDNLNENIIFLSPREISLYSRLFKVYIEEQYFSKLKGKQKIHVSFYEDKHILTLSQRHSKIIMDFYDKFYHYVV